MKITFKKVPHDGSLCETFFVVSVDSKPVGMVWSSPDLSRHGNSASNTRPLRWEYGKGGEYASPHYKTRRKAAQALIDYRQKQETQTKQ